MNLKRYIQLSLSLSVIFHGIAWAGEFPDLKIRSLLDIRAALTDDAIGWLDGSLGKGRYGGDSKARDDIRLEVAEASAIVSSRFGLSTSGRLHLKVDPEQDHAIEIVEGFVAYRPVSTSATRLKARAGIFFPPISLESKQIAWTSPYSISQSAINSWVGEELRALGAEVSVLRSFEDNRFSLTASLFQANDPAGSLLAWRGWALHDRKSGLKDRVPLPPLPSIETGGSIQAQARWVEPFHELDDRTGYYAAFDWSHMDIGQLKIMRYDNRADETAFDGNQYAWHTRFTSIGGRFEFENGIEMIAQYMAGDSVMGRLANGDAVVNIDFDSAYLLLSKAFKQHRISLRYDDFNVVDKDSVADDDNNEDGSALAFAWSMKVTRSQRLIAEVMQIDSNHANRADLGLSPDTKESIFQLSYRFIF